MQQQEQGPLSTWEAAKRLEAMFSPETENEDGEVPAEAMASIDEVSDDDLELEDEGQDPDEVEDEPDTFTVRVDGEEVEVTLPELIAGYSRQSSFTKKSQVLAEQRREVEGLEAQLRHERQQYAAALPQLQQMLESSLPPRPDPSSYRDAMEFARAERAWEQQRDDITAVKQERERMSHQQQEDQARYLQQIAQMEQDRLMQKLPEWRNDSVRQKETQELSDYLRQVGYGDQEISSLLDHRAVLIARKAKLYDELTLTGKAKVAKAKTMAPGTKDVPRKANVRDHIKRAKKTGSVDDAARAIASLIDF